MAPVSSIIAYAALSALVQSAPTDIVERDNVRNDPVPYCATIDEQHTDAGQAWRAAVTVPGDQEITVQEEHSVGVSWTVGLELGIGLEDLFKTSGLSAGAGLSFSKEVTDSLAESGSIKCPAGPWHCSLMVIPSVMKVKGHLTKGTNGQVVVEAHRDLDGEPFELSIPLKSDGGNPQMDLEPCTCTNLSGSEEPGHPEMLCSTDCSPKGSA